MLSLLIPVIVAELVLMVTALVVLVRAERTRGPKYMWALIILLGNLLGSIAFFIFGRRSD
nr:PLDc N-terminal domain-containing protein [Cohnella lubricantis]